MASLKTLAAEAAKPDIERLQEEALAAERRQKAKALKQREDIRRAANQYLLFLFGVLPKQFEVLADLSRRNRWGYDPGNSNYGRGYLVSDGDIHLILEGRNKDNADFFKAHLAHEFPWNDCASGACGWHPIGEQISDMKSLGFALAQQEARNPPRPRRVVRQ